MASPQKPLCRFGEKCYRKNKQHLDNYKHPKRKADDDDADKPTKKIKTAADDGKGMKIDDFFKKKNDKLQEKNDKPHDLSEEEKSQTDSEPQSEEEQDTQSGSDSDSSLAEMDEPVESPMDVKENIKRKFLVDMPEDFYHFWEFCKTESPACPCEALQTSCGLTLVGPFDIMAGNHKGVTKNRHGKRPNFLLHWRYFYDPPEFQTVIKGDSKTQFHLGYFRDDPKEAPVFVAANSAKTNCTISPKGDNLFAAVSNFIDERLKDKGTDSSTKETLKSMSTKVKETAKTHGYCLDVKSKPMRERDKKVVCKSFHGAGIVVPVDENEVGYREVPETTGDLKKMFKKIAASETEAERDKNFEPLQELITLVQFANDECDYGEGLELGMDLFCYGEPSLYGPVKQLMPLAYMLLRRPEFETIIKTHVRNRSNDSNLSQLD